MYRFLRTSLIVMLMLAGKAPLEAATMLSLSQSGNGNNNGAGNSSSRVRSQFSRDLAGLYQVNSFSLANIKQPHSDFAELYLLAGSAQHELATLTRQIALMSQTNAIIPDLKSADRAQAKIASKHQGDASRITDLARSSLVADNSYQLLSAFQLLEQETEIVQVKNRFSQPKENGYRDINVLVRLPKSQMIAEVQIHLASIAAIKNGAEHDNYALIQQLENSAKHQQRPLAETELFKIKQLQQQSSELYQTVWQQQVVIELDNSQQHLA